MTIQKSPLHFPQVIFHPSLLSHTFLILMSTTFAFIGLVIFVLASEADLTSDGAALTFLSQLSFSLCFLCIIWLAWIHWNYKYFLNSDYISEHEGILSPTLITSRIFYSQVRGVEIEQSILGRIINFGTLRIETDISAGASPLVMKGIRSPVRIKEIIMERACYFQENLNPHTSTI